MSLLLSPVSRDPAGDVTDPGTRPGWGAMIAAACMPAVLSYLAAAVLLGVLGAASGARGSLAQVARVGAVGWLAAHHVPLEINGAPLGVLPVLPTILLGALVARGAVGVVIRFGIHQPADAGWVVGAIAGTHGVLGAVLAIVATPVGIWVDPGQAALGCALVAGTAAGFGLARPCGLLDAALERAPGWVKPGVVAGTWGLVVLLAAGLATVLIALAVSAAQIVQLSGADAGSAVGLAALSIGYLPNAAVAAVSWLAGPGFSLGSLSVGPFAVHPGPVPAVPLLAALPDGPAHPWWALALAVPLRVGMGVGRRCAATGAGLQQRWRILGVAAAVPALGAAVLGGLAGGRLGNAAFDPVDVPFGALGVSVLVMTLLGGAVTIVLPVRRAPRAGPTPAEPDGGPVTAGSESSADDLENGGDSDARAEEEAVAPQQRDDEAAHGENSGKDTDG
ncbi:MAG: cell division protein PerM [Pseudonocardiaceae bacterium]